MKRNAEHVAAALRQVGVLLTATGVLTGIFNEGQIVAGLVVSLIGLILIWAASPEEK